MIPISPQKRTGMILVVVLIILTITLVIASSLYLRYTKNDIKLIYNHHNYIQKQLNIQSLYSILEASIQHNKGYMIGNKQSINSIDSEYIIPHNDDIILLEPLSSITLPLTMHIINSDNNSVNTRNIGINDIQIELLNITNTMQNELIDMRFYATKNDIPYGFMFENSVIKNSNTDIIEVDMGMYSNATGVTYPCTEQCDSSVYGFLEGSNDQELYLQNMTNSVIKLTIDAPTHPYQYIKIDDNTYKIPINSNYIDMPYIQL